MPQQFASDNNAGICPEALEALVRANAEGHVPGYGDDPWTERACARLRELFETDCEVFFVFNGTAANALALGQLCQPYHAVIAHAFSHIEEDEAGAPALFSVRAKNGLAVGEAVLFFDRELAAEFEWRVKQAGHLNSKMRLVTAPWLALLEGGVWFRNARHANAMATRLSERITNLPGVRLLAPVQ